MELNFRANGKLLLSGEYFVLDGADALALPLRKAQNLYVSHSIEKNAPFIQWQAFEAGTLWFEASFSSDFEIIDCSDRTIAEQLVKIFTRIQSHNSAAFSKQVGYHFKSDLEFNRNWGMGSSSTLIYLLASWAGLDALQLHFEVYEGSGYDVAAASRSTPFIYNIRNKGISIQPVQLHSDITSSLYFAYLGRKQASKKEIVNYRSRKQANVKIINQISSLTAAIAVSSDLNDFEKFVDEHEQIVSDFLNRRKIKQEFFSDYWGSVKSLGAWGGDFALFTHLGEFDKLKQYLKQKGIQTCFAYGDLVFDTKSEFKKK